MNRTQKQRKYRIPFVCCNCHKFYSASYKIADKPFTCKECGFRQRVPLPLMGKPLTKPWFPWWNEEWEIALLILISLTCAAFMFWFMVWLGRH